MTTLNQIANSPTSTFRIVKEMHDIKGSITFECMLQRRVYDIPILFLVMCSAHY